MPSSVKLLGFQSENFFLVPHTGTSESVISAGIPQQLYLVTQSLELFAHYVRSLDLCTQMKWLEKDLFFVPARVLNSDIRLLTIIKFLVLII